MEPITRKAPTDHQHNKPKSTSPLTTLVSRCLAWLKEKLSKKTVLVVAPIETPIEKKQLEVFDRVQPPRDDFRTAYVKRMAELEKRSYDEKPRFFRFGNLKSAK